VLSLLEDYGYKCLTAENGVEALKVYQENQEKIDLVLLDIAMPKMGGFEALDKIRAINPLVKVIMSSGFSVQDEAELFATGVKAFVPKPYQAKYLARKVREVLDKK
jgi:two-component system, cell cycle sensor histidine kinase and response regulator CckA